MKEYTITVYDENTDIVIDIFIGEFPSVDELREFTIHEIS